MELVAIQENTADINLGIVFQKQQQLKALRKQTKALEEEIELELAGIRSRHETDGLRYRVKENTRTKEEILPAEFDKKFHDIFVRIATVPIGKARDACGAANLADCIREVRTGGRR